MERHILLDIIKIMDELSIDDMYSFLKDEAEKNTELSYIFVSKILNIFKFDDFNDDLVCLVRKLIFNKDSIPIDANNYNIACHRVKNYKYIPALLAICEFRANIVRQNKIDIYTTGSWGDSLRAASYDLFGDNKMFNIINVSKYPYEKRFKFLRKNSINTDSVGAIIGTIIICLCMPTSTQMKLDNRRILPLITQGNLLQVLISMGYNIGDDIRITTSV